MHPSKLIPGLAILIASTLPTVAAADQPVGGAVCGGG